MEFTGIPLDAFAFLFEIRMQNDKAFFEANRERFNKNVRDPLRALALGLEPTLRDIDPAIVTAPNSCVSRIYRDTRFSKDKTPFRDHMWLGYKRDGEQNSESFVFYFGISPENYSYGCGMYDSLPPMMEVVRARAKAEEAYLVSIIDDLDAKGFSIQGNDYKRPKVSEGSEQVLRLVNKKGFYVGKESPKLKDACAPDLLDEIRQGFIALEPIYRFTRGMPRPASAGGEIASQAK